MEGDNLLNIDIEFHKGILFVRLAGVLNKNTVEKMNEEVTSLISDNGVRNIVFNINDLDSIDYYGINTLLHNYEICRNNKGKILVCGLNNILVKKRINKSRLLNYMYETTDELTAMNVINS